MVRLANCTLVHDFLKNILPDCFVDFVEQLRVKYIDFITRNSEIGNLFAPSVKKTSTGIQSSVPYNARIKFRKNIVLICQSFLEMNLKK